MARPCLHLHSQLSTNYWSVIWFSDVNWQRLDTHYHLVMRTGFTSPDSYTILMCPTDEEDILFTSNQSINRWTGWKNISVSGRWKFWGSQSSTNRCLHTRQPSGSDSSFQVLSQVGKSWRGTFRWKYVVCILHHNVSGITGVQSRSYFPTEYILNFRIAIVNAHS